MDDPFGIDSRNDILEDMAADHQLANDTASGMDIQEALKHQRGIDYSFYDRCNNGILKDMLSDDLIAQGVENGMDID